MQTASPDRTASASSLSSRLIASAIATVLAACSSPIPAPPPPVVTAPVIHAQPVCPGLKATAILSSKTAWTVQQCCLTADGVTFSCWPLP